MYKQKIIKRTRKFNRHHRDHGIEFHEESIDDFFGRVNDEMNLVDNKLISVNYINDKNDIYAVITYKEEEK